MSALLCKHVLFYGPSHLASGLQNARTLARSLQESYSQCKKVNISLACMNHGNTNHFITDGYQYSRYL